MSNLNIHIMLAGNPGTGKTSLASVYSRNVFPDEYIPTHGIDMLSSIKLIDYAGKNISLKLQLWDTGGNMHFVNIYKSYCKTMSCIILLFDIYDIETLRNVKSWYDELSVVGKNAMFFVVGSKIDKNANCYNTKIDKSEISNIISSITKMPYMEISSKNITGINELFEKIISCMITDNPKIFDDHIVGRSQVEKKYMCNVL